MGARLFGTDGVRGLANADLTPHLALSLATAAAKVLVERRPVAPDAPPPISVLAAGFFFLQRAPPCEGAVAKW